MYSALPSTSDIHTRNFPTEYNNENPRFGNPQQLAHQLYNVEQRRNLPSNITEGSDDYSLDMAIHDCPAFNRENSHNRNQNIEKIVKSRESNPPFL